MRAIQPSGYSIWNNQTAFSFPPHHHIKTNYYKQLTRRKRLGTELPNSAGKNTPKTQGAFHD